MCDRTRGSYTEDWPAVRTSLSPIGEAAFWFLLEHEFEIVYWNKNQKNFDRYDPHIEFAGCKWRAYNWSDEDCEDPNFECLEVKFWWYKYPGRGMMSNMDYCGNEWADWLKRAMSLVGSYDNHDC